MREAFSSRVSRDTKSRARSAALKLGLRNGSVCENAADENNSRNVAVARNIFNFIGRLVFLAWFAIDFFLDGISIDFICRDTG
jgi:hypothetical protein